MGRRRRAHPHAASRAGCENGQGPARAARPAASRHMLSVDLEHLNRRSRRGTPSTGRCSTFASARVNSSSSRTRSSPSPCTGRGPTPIAGASRTSSRSSKSSNRRRVLRGGRGVAGAAPARHGGLSQRNLRGFYPALERVSRTAPSSVGRGGRQWPRARRERRVQALHRRRHDAARLRARPEHARKRERGRHPASPRARLPGHRAAPQYDRPRTGDTSVCRGTGGSTARFARSTSGFRRSSTRPAQTLAPIRPEQRSPRTSSRRCSQRATPRDGPSRTT